MLTLANLGIALEAAVDSAAGTEMLRRATETDPGEPLGRFNLGNVVVLRGDFTVAKRYFRTAAAIDGTLAEAHFQLARIHLIERDNRSALSELRRGLAEHGGPGTGPPARNGSKVVTRGTRCRYPVLTGTTLDGYLGVRDPCHPCPWQGCVPHCLITLSPPKPEGRSCCNP